MAVRRRRALITMTVMMATIMHALDGTIANVALLSGSPQYVSLEGFDAPSAIAAKEEIRMLADAGCAVLFSSHVTETIERLCDAIAILDEIESPRHIRRRFTAAY
mgnify:CR=1 FL=1